jgi:hypothetical protein
MEFISIMESNRSDKNSKSNAEIYPFFFKESDKEREQQKYIRGDNKPRWMPAEEKHMS